MKHTSHNPFLMVALWLMVSFSMLANNIGSPEKIESIDPLPTAIIHSISSDNFNVEIPHAELKTEVNPAVNPFGTEVALGSQFFFPEMESDVMEVLAKSELSMAAAPPMPPGSFGAFMVAIAEGETAAKAKKAKKIIEKALDIGRYVDGLTGGNLESMPIIKEQMIGQTTVSIIFNSAKIYPNYAELEVYVKIEMPHKDFNNQDAVLYFGAQNIFFSQEKGIIQGSVGLLADYGLRIGNSDDAGVYLKKMEKTPSAGENGSGTPSPLDDKFDYTGTYINFDCDGFRELGIGGKIFFSREWVLPTDAFGVPLTQGDPEEDLSTTPRVKGNFQLTIQDVNDFLLTDLSIDPFILKKWDKMSFQLGNANLDLSSYRNPTSIPESYNWVQPNIWEGVYIESVSVTLPEPFKRNCSTFNESAADPEGNYPPPTTCRIKVTGEHLLIDEFGVSGLFSINGQAPLIGGAVLDGEWGWSLDSISIGFQQSDLTSFAFGGQLGVPILKKNGPLDYTASYDKAMDEYSIFVGNITDEKQFPVWNAAQVTLGSVGVEVSVTGGEFETAVIFSSASLTLGNPQDYATSQTGSPVKMPGVYFTDLRLATRGPIFSYGSLSLNTGDSKVVNFPVTINNYTLGTIPGNEDQMKFAFDLNINLMSSSGNAVSATGSLELIGEHKRDINGVRSWKFKDLIFNGAQVTVSVPQFYGHGVLKIYRDDEVYGNGFYCKLEAAVLGNGPNGGNMTAVNQGKFQLGMAAIFGSTDGYRYFLVDGFIGGDALKVPLFGPYYLDGFGGGVFHHMKPVGEAPTPTENTQINIGESLSGIIYGPYKPTRFGIKFSTHISTTGNLMEGLLTCIVRFDQNFALQNITFWGTADIMIPSGLTDKIVATADKIKSKIPNNLMPTSEIQAQNKAEMEAVDDGIKAKLGISLDFTQGFTFHGYAEVKIQMKNPLDPTKVLLHGKGTLDILLATGTGDWHFYLGGYYQNDQGVQIEVPSFFNEDDFITLSPVNVTLDYGGFKVSANAYFLTGNTLPGPPPPAPEVVDFFGSEYGGDNRGLLTCGGGNPAMGTGIAFGASAFFDFEKHKKGLFGSCLGGFKIDVGGGVGFDLALIKYPADSQCDISGDTPNGANGFRAAGRVYAFINIEGGHATCLPIPPLGAGLKIRFDVPSPSFFEVVAIIKIGKRWKFSLDIGEECGTPCASSVSVN